MKTPYIGFWKRAVAFILDSLLCSLPPAVICLPLLIWLFTKMIQGTPTPTQIVLSFGLYLLWMLLAILCYWLYFAYFESGAKQATLGKQLMGIKVIGKDGNRITFARATGRLFAKWISYMLLNFGFIMAGMTSKKRALHDYIAETYVVRADFQPGDELPDTPSHPYWMVFTAVVLVLSMLGMVLFNLVFAAAVLDRAPAAVAGPALPCRSLQRQRSPFPRKAWKTAACGMGRMRTVIMPTLPIWRTMSIRLLCPPEAQKCAV